MIQKGRILPLIVEIISDVYPEWILDAHFGRNFKNDIKVKSISEGDITQEIPNEYLEEK